MKAIFLLSVACLAGLLHAAPTVDVPQDFENGVNQILEKNDSEAEVSEAVAGTPYLLARISTLLNSANNVKYLKEDTASVPSEVTESVVKPFTLLLNSVVGGSVDHAKGGSRRFFVPAFIPFDLRQEVLFEFDQIRQSERFWNETEAYIDFVCARLKAYIKTQKPSIVPSTEIPTITEIATSSVTPEPEIVPAPSSAATVVEPASARTETETKLSIQEDVQPIKIPQDEIQQTVEPDSAAPKKPVVSSLGDSEVTIAESASEVVVSIVPAPTSVVSQIVEVTPVSEVVSSVTETVKQVETVSPVVSESTSVTSVEESSSVSSVSTVDESTVKSESVSTRSPFFHETLPEPIAVASETALVESKAPAVTVQPSQESTPELALTESTVALPVVPVVSTTTIVEPTVETSSVPVVKVATSSVVSPIVETTSTLAPVEIQPTTTFSSVVPTVVPTSVVEYTVPVIQPSSEIVVKPSPVVESEVQVVKSETTSPVPVQPTSPTAESIVTPTATVAVITEVVESVTAFEPLVVVSSAPQVDVSPVASPVVETAVPIIATKVSAPIVIRPTSRTASPAGVPVAVKKIAKSAVESEKF